MAHADWSVTPAKRWVAVAVRRGRRFEVHGPEPAGDPLVLLGRLSPGRGGSVVLGVDAPLGLPVAAARAWGVHHFPTWLVAFGTGRPWRDRVATDAAAIGPDRPFYPARPGGARQRHLLDAFGVGRLDDLRRACETAPPLRRPAACLFWTLGANQVGKAALSLWAELAVPGLRDHGARLWPFDTDLTAPGLVLAETYPAACLNHLGLSVAAKRRQNHRRAVAPGLRDRATRLGVSLPRALGDSLDEGFGAGAHGEDAFDCVVGLLGLLQVLRGERPAGPPDHVDGARTVEGWIVGVGVASGAAGTLTAPPGSPISCP